MDSATQRIAAPADKWPLIQLLCDERSGLLDRLISFNGQAVFGAVAVAATLLFSEHSTPGIWTDVARMLFGVGAVIFGVAVVMNWRYTLTVCRDLSDRIAAHLAADDDRRLLIQSAFPPPFGQTVFVAVAIIFISAALMILESLISLWQDSAIRE